MRTTTLGGRPGSLPIVLLRHLAGFVAGSVLVYGASQLVALESQPMLWIGAAAIAGTVAGLLDRGWLGAVFVEAGLLLGAWLALTATHHRPDEAAAAVAAAASLYLAVLLAGAAAYLILRLVRRLLS